MSKLIKFILFICAYSPLITIIGLQSVPEINLLTIILCFIPIIFGIVFGMYLYHETSKQTGQEYFTIIHAEDKTQEILSYIVPYILSLMTINIHNMQGALIFLILFVVLYAIYVNSSLIYINPLLSLMGYKIYSVKTRDSTSKEEIITIITKKINLTVDQKICLHELADLVYLEGK